MAAIPHTDTRPEFGRRNRNDDSSSSRESSPIRKHKRSFSPTSDDEVVISIADDDTPPPEGPIIRQAVAFSWTPSIPTAPASINTYQASPVPTQQHNTFFLPGQEVPVPPPLPKPPKPPKTKKKSAPRFSSQTGRFRINSYDPTPTAAPALTSGDGPYASMYRANAPSDITDADGSARSEPAETGSRKKPKPSDSRPKASTSKARVATSKAKSSASKRKAANSDQGPSNMALQPVLEPQEGPSRNSYYRRDYEQSNAHASSSHSPSNYIPNNSPSPLQDPQRLQVTKRPNIPLRLVTILIEDMRGDFQDSQLVEVRVALRDSEDTERDGYWANAEDICKTLQASPSRIDGPAKVYALRGKYRQIILKVTADNVDEWVTANVVVNPDRTLDVVVQTGLPPGRPIEPPRAQRQVSESESFMSPRAIAQLPHSGAVSAHQEHGSRKRHHSPSDDYRDRSSGSRQWSPSTLASSPRGSPSRGPSTAYQTPLSAGTPDARLQFPHHQPQNRGYSPTFEHQAAHSESESSESEDESDIDARISKEVDALIQHEPTWVDYFKLSAKPRSASAVLREYGIVQGLVDKWVGKPVPSGPLIQKSHIAQALQIEEPERTRYMSDCAEILHLIALYGPEGRRLRDPEVVEKANDDSNPPYNAKPIKKLLKLLRKIDEQWVAAHP
ncbi:hypothetical protein FB451DRAFT_1211336 [Mycena latifolia]|nr:hypothetical protein FB451DRAFT_1211336 [Mycena latifolia]